MGDPPAGTYNVSGLEVEEEGKEEGRGEERVRILLNWEA